VSRDRLFAPLQIGAVAAPNRILMAPLTATFYEGGAEGYTLSGAGTLIRETAFQPQRHRGTEKIPRVTPTQPLTCRVSSRSVTRGCLPRTACASVSLR
jgi:2,4-dienoyl-CoA reductase-like NADH-dependent reductase (Old Yellow Enzyme family)